LDDIIFVTRQKNNALYTSIKEKFEIIQEKDDDILKKEQLILF